jgi:hypothetical protein
MSKLNGRESSSLVLLTIGAARLYCVVGEPCGLDRVMGWRRESAEPIALARVSATTISEPNGVLGRSGICGIPC